MTRKSVLGALVPVAVVLAVHGTNLKYPLFYDDYTWLSVSDHPGWFVDVMSPGRGAFVYRPGLAMWFVGMRSVFGLSALSYHLAALAFLAAAALAVRWLGLELGLGNVAATLSGALYGAFAPLTLTTIWASAAGSSLGVALAVGSIALVCRRSSRRQLAAMVLLAAAILTRDATVVTPALATLVLVARSPDGQGLATILRRTWGLWAVAGAYLVVRLGFGIRGSNSGPYAVDFLGAHVVSNLVTLMRFVSRFALPDDVADRIRPILPVWDVVVWLSLFGAAVWAVRRRSYLPMAGIGWFLVSLLPVLLLINHPMETYYLDLAAIGLAITIGSLGRMVRLTSAVAAAVVSVFVLVQAMTVQLYQDRSYYTTTILERTEVLKQIAATERPRDGELEVATHCPLDREFSKDGDLFRVLQNNPELRVRFEILEPETCAP